MEGKSEEEKLLYLLRAYHNKQLKQKGITMDYDKNTLAHCIGRVIAVIDSTRCLSHDSAGRVLNMEIINMPEFVYLREFRNQNLQLNLELNPEL